MLYIITHKLRLTTVTAPTPQILPSEQRGFRITSGPSSLLQGGRDFGKGRILAGKQELCDLPTLCGGSPVHPGWHQNKPSKAAVPDKPHRSDRGGGKLWHPKDLIGRWHRGKN